MRIIDVEYDSKMNPISVTCEDEDGVYGFEAVQHGRWEDDRCSECGVEAEYSTREEPVYDYDWDENLYLSHYETIYEYRFTNYCPNCGAKMELEVQYD